MRRQLTIGSAYYSLDDYLFNRVTQRFARRQTLTRFDFYAIITWKSNRSISKVRDGLRTANLTTTALMTQVSQCATDQDRMNMLIEINGIGVPVASAILTVCYPDRFTVLDYRAWEALFHFKRVMSKTMPTGTAGYFNTYLPACRTLAQQLRMRLRELDRAMWGWSKRESIRR
jgi:hypothetical protein